MVTTQSLEVIIKQIGMAGYRPSASTPTGSKSPLGKSLHNSSLLSRSGLDDTLHSTQSLSGRASIMTYNNTQYPSATAALAAYINDFENANPLSQTYHRTVEDLFTPRSVMLRTVDRSLETGVRDTRDEWRRYTSKKLLDESFSEMVQADVEREKAESMMESSRLLTADLSPLPGSSVITEVESGASLSTDLLLHAPLYPTLNQPSSRLPEAAVPEWNPRRDSNREKGSFRRELQQRFSGSSLENQSVKGRTQDSSLRSRVRREERGPGFRVNISPVKKSVSGTIGDALKSGQSLPTHIPGKADWRGFSTSNVGSSKHDIHKRKRNLGNENVASAYASKTEGGRRPPSWIQDLDLTGASSLVSQARPGGRAPPSWIQDLDKSGLSGVAAENGISGRAPPSWVQDLDVSGISSTVRSKSLVQREGGRPPPSWIQELNSTITSEKQNNFRSLKSFEKTLPASHTFMRTNSGGDLLSEAHRGKGKSLEFGTYPQAKKASSFTTDDLIMASPTGKDFHRPSHNSRGQYSSHETNSNDIPSHFNLDSYALNGAALIDERLASNSIKTSSIGKDSRFSNLQTETSQRGSLRSTRATPNLKVSLKTGHAASLASTPKRSVAFEVTPARRSLNGYLVEGGSGSQSSRGGQLSDARQTKRSQVEDDRQREDALLLRAQKVLDDARASKSQPSSSHRYHGNTNHHDNSLLTDEVLDGDRSWEKNLPSLKPLKTVQGTEEHDADHHQDIVAKFLDDCLRSVDENQKLTGGLQPGPVEALKNMLFTLQGMAPNSQASSPTKDAHAPTNEAGEVISSIRSSPSWSPQSGSKDTSTGKSFMKYTRRDTGTSGSGTDFEEAPGGKSLQRAMEHLTRLKCLVNGGSNPNTQPSSANGQVMSS